MKRAAFVFLFLGLSAVTAATNAWAKQTVIVALFDGFTPSMMAAGDTPNFDQLKQDGTWSDHLTPVFPTLSLTNHTSFITGCLPENHGILNNKFIDPDRGLYDHSDDADWRTGCATLFEDVEAGGLKAAVLGWAGRKSSTRGALASYISDETKFEDFPDDPARAEQAVALLDAPVETRPDLIVIYFQGPDSSAHFIGMDAPETMADVEQSDAIIGRLREKLEAIAGQQDVALFVGTDHGMTPVTHLVNIARILRRHGVTARTASSGTNSFVYLDDPSTAPSALAKLGGYEEFSVFGKGKYPAYAHIGASSRAPDVLLVAKPPYFVEDPDLFPWWLLWTGVTWIWPDVFDASMTLKATHGYDPAMPEMHGIFYAWGTHVAKGKELAHIDITDVHPTVLSYMGVAPTSHVDGQVVEGLIAR
jgi:predicted AlkP superfamily pyrophosphatase or phosphodiesterase